MSRIYLLLPGFLLALLPTGLLSQVLTAGQTSGERLTYDDFTDITLSSDYWWDNDIRDLDLNNDNVPDIQFWTLWIYYSHPGVEEAVAGAKPLTGIEFSTEADQPGWLRKHAAGEIIDSTLIWTSGDADFSSYPGPGGGFFSGEGYMAYRICGPDTLYGWIRADRGTTFPSTLSLFEQAYITTKSSLSRQEREPLNKLMQIHGRTIHLDLPSENGQAHYLLGCYEVSGRKLFEVTPGQGTHSVDLSGLRNGVYIIRLTSPDGQAWAVKIMI